MDIYSPEIIAAMDETNRMNKIAEMDRKERERKIMAFPVMLEALKLVGSQISPSGKRGVLHCGELGLYFNNLELDQITEAIRMAEGK